MLSASLNKTFPSFLYYFNTCFNYSCEFLWLPLFILALWYPQHCLPYKDTVRPLCYRQSWLLQQVSSRIAYIRPDWSSWIRPRNWNTADLWPQSYRHTFRWWGHTAGSWSQLRYSYTPNTNEKNEWMDGWMNEWMDEWMNELMNGWMNEWMDEWMNGWMNEWMDERMNEWMNGWMDGWMNGWMDELINEWMKK